MAKASLPSEDSFAEWLVNYSKYGPPAPAYPVRYTMEPERYYIKPYDLVPPGRVIWDEVKWDLVKVKPEPKFKFTDSRRWDRPYDYPLSLWQERGWHRLDLANYEGKTAYLWSSWYFEDWAAELAHEDWLNGVADRLGLVIGPRGCTGIRPKPQLGAAWDALVEKWGSE